ncbi:MarR family transcriptional regulator [Priestia flexa]|uniref:MarR family transcriptional regulator n=1 Tax=Priestia flexa TaxID=86664 RepID=UPI0004736188|nr:helix-turn-helix domain-containing protein [Priestia flexa]
MNEYKKYFESIVEQLNANDVSVLSYLYKQNATDSIHSIKTLEITDHLQISRSGCSRIINRLIACNLVKMVGNARNLGIYLTPFGCTALDIRTNGEMTI